MRLPLFLILIENELELQVDIRQQDQPGAVSKGMRSPGSSPLCPFPSLQVFLRKSSGKCRLWDAACESRRGLGMRMDQGWAGLAMMLPPSRPRLFQPLSREECQHLYSLRLLFFSSA